MNAKVYSFLSFFFFFFLGGGWNVAWNTYKQGKEQQLRRQLMGPGLTLICANTKLLLWLIVSLNIYLFMYFVFVVVVVLQTTGKQWTYNRWTRNGGSGRFFFFFSRQERSSELIMVGRGMVAVVDELLAPTDRDFSSFTHIDHVRLC